MHRGLYILFTAPLGVSETCGIDKILYGLDLELCDLHQFHIAETIHA